MKNIINKVNISWLILAILTYVLITGLMNVGIINSVYQVALMTIGINIILAVSLNLIIGVTGQFSLGHAGFMCIGAYVTAVVVKSMPSTAGLLVGIVLGAIISGLVALIVAVPTLRLKGDYLAIATLGFSEIIRIVILNMKITNGAAGLNVIKLTTWPILFVSIVIAILVVVNFARSAPGRACISIREDEIASESMGINTTKSKTIAFVIGAMLASLAGALYAANFYFVKPDMFNVNKSIDMLVIVVFGGMGSITGSVIAAIVIGIINVFLQNFSDIRMIIYGAALVLIMIFRPGGLMGTKEFTFSAIFKRFSKSKEVK